MSAEDGKKRSETRKATESVGFRLLPTDYGRFKTLAAEVGYKSLNQFARDRLLHSRGLTALQLKTIRTLVLRAADAKDNKDLLQSILVELYQNIDEVLTS